MSSPGAHTVAPYEAEGIGAVSTATRILRRTTSPLGPKNDIWVMRTPALPHSPA